MAVTPYRAYDFVGSASAATLGNAYTSDAGTTLGFSGFAVKAAPVKTYVPKAQPVAAASEANWETF